MHRLNRHGAEVQGRYLKRGPQAGYYHPQWLQKERRYQRNQVHDKKSKEITNVKLNQIGHIIWDILYILYHTGPRFNNCHLQLTQKVSILKNKIPQNSNIRVFLKGDVFFLKKKGPCQECPGCRQSLFSPKIKKSRNSDKNHTISRKGTKGKMTPQGFSIQCQSPFSIFSRN